MMRSLSSKNAGEYGLRTRSMTWDRDCTYPRKASLWTLRKEVVHVYLPLKNPLWTGCRQMVLCDWHYMMDGDRHAVVADSIEQALRQYDEGTPDTFDVAGLESLLASASAIVQERAQSLTDKDILDAVVALRESLAGQADISDLIDRFLDIDMALDMAACYRPDDPSSTTAHDAWKAPLQDLEQFKDPDEDDYFDDARLPSQVASSQTTSATLPLPKDVADYDAIRQISLESRLAIQRALDAKWPPVRFHKNPAAECVDVLSILAQVAPVQVAWTRYCLTRRLQANFHRFSCSHQSIESLRTIQDSILGGLDVDLRACRDLFATIGSTRALLNELYVDEFMKFAKSAQEAHGTSCEFLQILVRIVTHLLRELESRANILDGPLCSIACILPNAKALSSSIAHHIELQFDSCLTSQSSDLESSGRLAFIPVTMDDASLVDLRLSASELPPVLSIATSMVCDALQKMIPLLAVDLGDTYHRTCIEALSRSVRGFVVNAESIVQRSPRDLCIANIFVVISSITYMHAVARHLAGVIDDEGAASMGQTRTEEATSNVASLYSMFSASALKCSQVAITTCVRMCTDCIFISLEQLDWEKRRTHEFAVHSVSGALLTWNLFLRGLHYDLCRFCSPVVATTMFAIVVSKTSACLLSRYAAVRPTRCRSHQHQVDLAFIILVIRSLTRTVEAFPVPDTMRARSSSRDTDPLSTSLARLHATAVDMLLCLVVHSAPADVIVGALDRVAARSAGAAPDDPTTPTSIGKLWVPPMCIIDESFDAPDQMVTVGNTVTTVTAIDEVLAQLEYDPVVKWCCRETNIDLLRQCAQNRPDLRDDDYPPLTPDEQRLSARLQDAIKSIQS